MKARITVQVCDLCQSYTADVLVEGGVEIPVLIIYHETGGDSLKNVFICGSCMSAQTMPLRTLYQQIAQTRTESQS